MSLKKVFEIYKLKKELPTEKDIQEVFENLKPENFSKSFHRNHLQGKLIIPYTVKEGDIIRLFPSVDALDMNFLVWGVFPEEDLVRLMLLSEFIEFATLKDVKINLEDKEYIVQTDIFIDMPYQTLHKAFEGKYLFKESQISKEVLKKIDRVFYGEIKGDGTIITPTKALFKKEEAKRVAVLINEYIEKLESYFENLKILEKEPLAASSKERFTLIKHDFLAIYDPEKEILLVKPIKEDVVYREGRIVLNVENKEVVLYEGLIYEQIPLPLPKRLYKWDVLEKGLKLEVY